MLRARLLTPSFTSFRLLATLIAGLSAGAVGCNDGVGGIPIGKDDADDFKLGGVPVLKHIADALEGGSDLTIGELITRGDDVVFNKAPNPAQLLKDINTLDDERSRAGREPLSVLTWNVALLDAAIFGFIPYVSSPNLDQRRRVLPGLAFETGADVILLQELWVAEDVEAFERRARGAGYVGFSHDRGSGNDGLIVFVRSDVIAGGTTATVDFSPYASQVGTEYFPGPGIARGWMSVNFVHAGIGPVTVFNTHMQAFPENWLGRVKQARELGIEMRAAKEENNSFVLVGGDFNSGPYYKNAEWTSPDASTIDRWFHNAIAWPTLLAYGELVDAAIMGRSAEDAIADVTLGDTVRNDSTKALDIPGAEQGWCERTPATTFTATDCNKLYFQQYAGTEAPARLDHIFVNDEDGRVVVEGSTLMFTDKQEFGDLVVEPSDHYGVRVDMLVTPRR